MYLYFVLLITWYGYLFFIGWSISHDRLIFCKYLTAEKYHIATKFDVGKKNKNIIYYENIDKGLLIKQILIV